MKKCIGFFMVAIFVPIVINTVFKFFLNEYQEITNVIFSVYSVFFAILITSTYNFNTASYSENFEKKLDRELSCVRKKAIIFYIIVVLLFVIVDLIIYDRVFGEVRGKIRSVFSSTGFSFVYSVFLLISETQLYRLRDDIKRRYRKERYIRN